MDFLTFKSFISIKALIIFYYIGVLILPVGLWLLIDWLISKYDFFNTQYKKGKNKLWELLDKKQQTKLALFLLFFFLFMELFWRMLFEFLIAYMQIRDALVQ